MIGHFRNVAYIMGVGFAGISALFMILAVVVTIYRMFKTRTDTLEDEKIKYMIGEIKHVNKSLGAIHEKINAVRDSQKDLIIQFTNEYIKKDDHEIICKERRERSRS